MKIHTLTIETRHGRGVYAHATRAAAFAALAAHVRERAAEITALQGELDDMDDAEAVEHFYSVIDDESADIEECELALPDPEPLRLKLLEAVRSWEAFDRDEPVNGGDLVDWFATWRREAKRLLRIDEAEG